MHARDLEHAVRALIVERRKLLSEHCSLDELQAYDDESLPADHREAVAEHVALCEDCAVLLLYAVISPRLEDAACMPIEEGRIEESWTQLQPQLQNGKRSGRPLVTLLKSATLPADEALALAVRISRELAKAHAQRRVIPDLRAENVLVLPSGEVRLLERGFAPAPATLESGDRQSAQAALSDLYRSLSPEQIAGEDPTPESNVFSLGVLFHELLTGVSPFRGESALETAGRVLSLDPIPAAEVNPALVPALGEVLDRMLAKEPETRPSAAAVLRAIESVIASETTGLAEVANVDRDIERLYERIVALAEQQPSTCDAARDEEIERCYVQLRLLQSAEAQAFRADFEASLAMPIDAGKEILERLRTLRKELEDPASPDTAAGDSDGAQAPAESSRRSLG
jgi:hypothetical protein